MSITLQVPDPPGSASSRLLDFTVNIMPRDPSRHTRSRPVGRFFTAKDLPGRRGPGKQKTRRHLNLREWIVDPEPPPTIAIMFSGTIPKVTDSFVSTFRREEYPRLRWIWNHVVLATPTLPRWDCLSEPAPKGLPFDHRHLQVRCMDTPNPGRTFQSSGVVSGPNNSQRIHGKWIPTNIPRNQWTQCPNDNHTLFQIRRIDTGIHKRRFPRSKELDFFQCRGDQFRERFLQMTAGQPGIYQDNFWFGSDCLKSDYRARDFTKDNYTYLLPICRDCSEGDIRDSQRISGRILCSCRAVYAPRTGRGAHPTYVCEPCLDRRLHAYEDSSFRFLRNIQTAKQPVIAPAFALDDYVQDDDPGQIGGP